MGSQIEIAQSKIDELELIAFIQRRLSVGVVPRKGVDTAVVTDFATDADGQLMIVPLVFAPDGLRGSQVFLRDGVTGKLAPRLGTYLEWNRSAETPPGTFGLGRLYLHSRDQEPEVRALMTSLVRHSKKTYPMTVDNGQVWVGPDLAALFMQGRAKIIFANGTVATPVDAPQSPIRAKSREATKPRRPS